MPQLIKLVTPEGYAFWSGAEVLMGESRYDMEDLTPPQQSYVAGKLQEQALNAVYGGRVRFQAQNIPTYEEAFGPP